MQLYLCRFSVKYFDQTGLLQAAIPPIFLRAILFTKNMNHLITPCRCRFIFML
uniref:Uncharacterized protein n=1 Tax=Anguilla anguilla TaxID=7936 RepID=A0A0E9SI20_ANGAN